jgi:hypothetical protein
MSVIEGLVGQQKSSVKSQEYPADRLRFDRVMVALSYWFLVGMYLDGWAHHHGQTDSSFFTPWHAVLYTGALAVGIALGLKQGLNMLKGHAWDRALPSGYFAALWGIVIFFVGGVFDFAWHTLFGIEENMQALLSPSHLLLASGAFLFISAPLRAAWGRRDSAKWADLLPAILSLGAILSQLTFFTQYANFASRPQTLIQMPSGADTYYFDQYGVMSMLIPTCLGVGVVLFSLRRWKLPVGAVTLLWTLNTALMIWLRFRFVSGILPALIAFPFGGVLADFYLWRFKPSADRPEALRWFAISIPFVTSLVYLLILNSVGDGLWWQIHMWLGVPFLTGIAGLFLSLLSVPPGTSGQDQPHKPSHEAQP